MERLGRQRKSFELNGNALRAWAVLFLAAGVVGRGVIQKHMLGVDQLTAAQTIAIMNASETNMTLATVSLVLEAMETCAVPIFALLLIQGFQNTANLKDYLFRVLKLGVLAEIPYSLLMGNSPRSLNPVFGVAFGLILLYFYQVYAEKGFKNTLIKLFVTIAAVVWCEMLRIDFGAALILITASMWPYREKPLYRNITGATMSLVCSMISPFYMASAMSFMTIHFYNGEKSSNSRKVNYLAYPVLLVLGCIVGWIL